MNCHVSGLNKLFEFMIMWSVFCEWIVFIHGVWLDPSLSIGENNILNTAFILQWNIFARMKNWESGVRYIGYSIKYRSVFQQHYFLFLTSFNSGTFLFLLTTVFPLIYFCKTLGMWIIPFSSCSVSDKAISRRGMAQAVPFRVWTNLICPSLVLYWMFSLLKISRSKELITV